MEREAGAGPPVGPHAVFGLDATGRCTHSTGPALIYLGFSPGELVGTNLFDLYRSDPVNVAALRRVLAGESFNLEREFEGRLLSTYFEPVRDPDGAVTGALGVTTDVTEQRRIEGQLRAARERAGLLAEVSGALSRELLDPQAVLHVTVRSVTDALADVGLVWICGDERTLVPKAGWRSGAASGKATGSGPTTMAGVARLDVSAAETMTGPGVVELDTATAAGFASVTDRLGATAVLRTPLRAGGKLLGAIDLARGISRGTFTDEEADLVSEIAQRCALALDHALLLTAHQEAREQLVKFQALADASDNLIAISDNEDRTVYLNPRVDASGLQLTGRVWETAVGAQVNASVRDAMRKGLDTAGRWSGDVTVVTPETSLIVNAAVFRLFHPETGAPLGTAWIGQDVTELRTTEAALREANADLMQFKALVDASPDFIAIADLQGRVRYVNPGGRELAGIGPEVDVSATTIADYSATAEGPVNFEQRIIPAVWAEGHWEGEATLRRRNSPPVPVATSAFLVRDATTREPFALATVQRDLTERLAAERAVRELAEQRQALLTRLVDAQDAERSIIAADVHDDPVQACAAVEMSLRLLQRQARDSAPELLGRLDALQATIAGATSRLRALLFDLEPPDLERGLTGALTRAAQEIFDNTGVRWSVDGADEPDVPDTVRAIGYRIAKEAMTNARKHARAGKVSIAVSGLERGIAISIEDDGVGLGLEPMAPSPGHRGLLSMQDRATVAGGRCTIGNRLVGGTVVTAWLPGAPTAGVGSTPPGA